MQILNKILAIQPSYILILNFTTFLNVTKSFAHSHPMTTLAQKLHRNPHVLKLFFPLSLPHLLYINLLM